MKALKKNVTKVITSAALVFSLAGTLTGCGENSSKKVSGASDGNAAPKEAELTTVRYATMPGSATQWYGILGQEKGIWEKYGLDVEITEFANGIQTVDSVSMNQADIGFVTDFAGLNRFGNTQGNTDLKFFEEQSKVSNYSLYVNPDSISKIEDLKDKKVMVMKGTFLEYLDAVTLEQAGLKKDDIEELPVESGTDILAMAQKGQADAIWTAGDTAVKLQGVGWEAIKKQAEIGINTYVFHVASDKYLKENAETVQNFIKAYEEVNQYVQKNMDEAAGIINEKTGMGEDIFKNSVQSVDIIPEFTEESVEALQKIDGWASSNGFYEKSIDVHDFINTDAIKAVYPDNVDVK